jgi:ankyrin repeat protein
VAASKGNAHIAKVLLAARADLEAVDRDGYVRALAPGHAAKAHALPLTRALQTALLRAARDGFSDVVKVLCDFDANVNCSDPDRQASSPISRG